MSISKSPVTIIGFGSQAKAWALNLKDSGLTVLIALKKESASRDLAQKLGFSVIDLQSDQLKNSTIIAVLIPDDQHLNFLNSNHQHLPQKAHLIYAHGFSLSKHKLESLFPQFRHSLLAPKAIASEVRYQYEIKGKIGAAFSAADEQTENELRALAIQAGFNALFKSNAEEETKADLFSEQSLLCSILPYVALKSYQVLRKNNVSKEVAFMECFLELKSISQALVTLGPEAFFKLISPNALIGSQKGRRILLDKNFDQGLEKLFRDIDSKDFYKETEVDAEKLREQVLKEWQSEEMNTVFKELKAQLIN